MTVETAAYRFSPLHFKILEFLSGPKPGMVSLEKLSQACRLEISQLNRELEMMVRDGYGFERVRGRENKTHPQNPDWFYPERITRGFADLIRLGKNLQAFQKISGSTNDRALLLGEKGAADGTLFGGGAPDQGPGPPGPKAGSPRKEKACSLFRLFCGLP